MLVAFRQVKPEVMPYLHCYFVTAREFYAFSYCIFTWHRFFCRFYFCAVFRKSRPYPSKKWIPCLPLSCRRAYYKFVTVFARRELVLLLPFSTVVTQHLVWNSFLNFSLLDIISFKACDYLIIDQPWEKLSPITIIRK